MKLLKIELKDDQALSIATLLIKEAESLRSTWEGDGSDRARMFRDEADDLELLARLIFHKGKYSGFENYKEQILKVYSNS